MKKRLAASAAVAIVVIVAWALGPETFGQREQSGGPAADDAPGASDDIPAAALAAIDDHIAHQAAAMEGRHADAAPHAVARTNLYRQDEDVIVVLFRVTRRNDTLVYLAMFDRLAADQWFLKEQLYLGGRGTRHLTDFSVSEYAITIRATEFAGSEPLSSPSRNVEIEIDSRHGLLNVGREVIDVQDR